MAVDRYETLIDTPTPNGKQLPPSTISTANWFVGDDPLPELQFGWQERTVSFLWKPFLHQLFGEHILVETLTNEWVSRRDEVLREPLEHSSQIEGVRRGQGQCESTSLSLLGRDG